jgi:hypothetical protein
VSSLRRAASLHHLGEGQRLYYVPGAAKQVPTATDVGLSQVHTKKACLSLAAADCWLYSATKIVIPKCSRKQRDSFENDFVGIVKTDLA